MNICIVNGRLTADPDLRTTPNGTSVCTFRIANNERYGTEQKTNYFSVVAWRQTAEFVSKFFSKGKAIIVSGAMGNREYTDKNGEKRTVFEITAEKVEFGETKGEQGSNANAKPNVDVNPEDVEELDDDLPF